MGKNINFKARSKNEFEVQLRPYPAVKTLPKWYRDHPSYENTDFVNDNRLHVRGLSSNATFKKCMPLLDSMSAGYIIPLWADVEVEAGIIPEIHWRTVNPVFAIHGKSTTSMVPPEGYNSQVFKYLNCWIPETPKGYSCLITSPFGHNDLVFRAITAVVDTDKSPVELVFPIWVKNNFNGIVEKGTPIAQIIPFKRDDWESTFDYYENGVYKNIIEERTFNSTIISHYVKNYWSKKKFK